ncbi:gene transfer agent family protein [Paracoccus cavernae]|uniref:gene transfer agent family protein n=1 Tax=Paracoccus cavernae TaxID=1571207 RepID=UPI00360ED12C
MMEPVVLIWPGGEHPFRLALRELQVIQEKTDFGPEHLLHRINLAQWAAADLFEILRNGLIGGGMPHVEALKACRKAFEDHPLISFKVPAQAVLAACLYGPPDDQPGESMPVADPTPDDQKTDDGNSPSITETAP